MMLPKRAASKLGPLLPKMVRSATPEGERRRRDDTDRGVRADPPAAGDAVDGQRRGQAPEPGAQVIVDADDRARGEAAEDGMGQPVADIAHAAQGDVDADQAAQAAGKGGDDDSP